MLLFHKNIRKIMKLLLLLFLSINLFAVITIAPTEIGKEAGFSGAFKGSFETKRGNSDVDNYSAGLKTQYDNNSSYVIWSDIVFDYGKASGETNTNKTYAHLRFIHSLTDNKSINYELFGQVETNYFTEVKHRFLLGGGLRYHNNMQKYGNLFFGLGAFSEDIKYLSAADQREQNIRINSYISYTKDFNKKSKLSYVMYYQPRADDFGDYIFSNGLEMTILIYEQLYLSFVLYYDVDSAPAVGIGKEDFTQKTSFIYRF